MLSTGAFDGHRPGFSVLWKLTLQYPSLIIKKVFFHVGMLPLKSCHEAVSPAAPPITTAHLMRLFQSSAFPKGILSSTTSVGDFREFLQPPHQWSIRVLLTFSQTYLQVINHFQNPHPLPSSTTGTARIGDVQTVLLVGFLNLKPEAFL